MSMCDSCGSSFLACVVKLFYLYKTHDTGTVHPENIHSASLFHSLIPKCLYCPSQKLWKLILGILSCVFTFCSPFVGSYFNVWNKSIEHENYRWTESKTRLLTNTGNSGSTNLSHIQSVYRGICDGGMSSRLRLKSRHTDWIHSSQLHCRKGKKKTAIELIQVIHLILYILWCDY